MVGVVVRRPAPRAGVILAVAGALGLLAFAADAVEGLSGRILIALVSSGFASGTAALCAGRAAPRRRAALTSATVLLIIATLVYHPLILVVSRRWSGGTPADGSSPDAYDLRSLAVTAAAWLLISMVAGPALGLLGQAARTARTPIAALAAGVACGLLSGQGRQEAAVAPAGHPGAAGPLFTPGIGAAELIQIVLPVALLAWPATVHRLWRAWPVLLLAPVATATVSAVRWLVLHPAANRFG